uniref:Uncharacterized protein n=1 Tax=Timema cristinae TaxID=61476 RepID=A0A7R9CP56_TIMCR|nr:unnamed protein product [Timema cristinae]
MATVPVLAGAAGVEHPFQRHNVSEWSHLDRLTGVLEHARVESDHWAASRAGSTGNYNKWSEFLATDLGTPGLRSPALSKFVCEAVCLEWGKSQPCEDK